MLWLVLTRPAEWADWVALVLCADPRLWPVCMFWQPMSGKTLMVATSSLMEEVGVFDIRN